MKTSSLALLGFVTLGGIAGGSSAMACGNHYTTYYTRPSVERVVVYKAPTQVVVSEASVTPIAINAVAQRTIVTAGTTMTANLPFLGREQGQVWLTIGATTINCEIVEWKDAAATFKVPPVGVSDVATAELRFMRATGDVASTLDVAVKSRPALVEKVEVGPAITKQAQGVAPEFSGSVVVAAPQSLTN